MPPLRRPRIPRSRPKKIRDRSSKRLPDRTEVGRFETRSTLRRRNFLRRLVGTAACAATPVIFSFNLTEKLCPCGSRLKTLMDDRCAECMSANERTPAHAMTYQEHRQRQREYEHRKWMALSESERERMWLRRQAYLWTHFLTLNRKWANPTVGCPACHPLGLVAHSWPEYFECICGTFVIVDRWLADGIERVTMMTNEGLAKFAVHAKTYDLYDYPLEQRLLDLNG